MQKERKEKHFLKQPEYIGGPKAMTEFIYKNLRYPPEAFTLGVEGMVVLEMTINHKGEVTEGKIKKSLGHGCDEEAIRVAKLLKFFVGKNRGVQVTYHKRLNIQYKIPLKTADPAPVAPPNQGMVLQYSLVSEPPKPQENQQNTQDTVQKPTTTYSYTIHIE